MVSSPAIKVILKDHIVVHRTRARVELVLILGGWRDLSSEKKTTEELSKGKHIHIFWSDRRTRKQRSNVDPPPPRVHQNAAKDYSGPDQVLTNYP